VIFEYNYELDRINLPYAYSYVDGYVDVYFDEIFAEGLIVDDSVAPSSEIVNFDAETFLFGLAHAGILLLSPYFLRLLCLKLSHYFKPRLLLATLHHIWEGYSNTVWAFSIFWTFLLILFQDMYIC